MRRILVLLLLVPSAVLAQPPTSDELWSEAPLEDDVADLPVDERVSEESLGEHVDDAVRDAVESVPDSATPIALPTGEGKSAVTPQAISLPSAEGSIEGMGESFSPVLSSGTGTFSVPIALPAGRAGVQPSLALAYSTSGGNGVVGFGWGLGVPMISRQTDRGLPNYVDRPAYHAEEDRFIYNGGQELVPVDSSDMALVDAFNPVGTEYATGGFPDGVGSDWQEYRARVEGGFMRFFRAPDSTSWVVVGKDGTRFDFGLVSGGPSDLDATPSLQSENDDGTGPIFQWLLTRMSDAHGSTVYYEYFAHGGERYLSNIYYVSPAGCAGASAALTRACDEPLSDYGVRVHLDYESREDVFSTYTAGWRVETAYRVRRITVTVAPSMETAGDRVLARRYHLEYDAASYHSLLTELTVEGRPDALNMTRQVYEFSDVNESALTEAIVGRTLPPMRFTYSQTPSGPIDGFGGIDASMRASAASPPHSFDDSRTDFFDVNSDGLPDVIVTDPARYRSRDGRPAVGVFFNGFSGDTARPGEAGSFSGAVPVPVGRGLSDVLDLGNLNVVPMDIDGDGRSDLLHMPRRTTYGWFTPTRMGDGAVAETSPARQGWRFSYAEVNLPRGVLDPRIDLDRDSEHFKVLDVNNDHLIDVVRTTGTSIQTWLNLGWLPGGEGRFGSARYRGTAWELSVDPIESCLLHDGTPLDFADPEVRLADMNGDGIVDIVKVRRGRVVWWPGRGIGVWGEGERECSPGFEADREIHMDSPPETLGIELDGVFLSDVNEDGTADIVEVGFDRVNVWFNRAGESFTDELEVRVAGRAPSFAPRLRFADLDASGTTDLVYGNASGYEYIDFMGGEKPRMLVGVENGLGATTSLEYESSVTDYLRDLADAAGCLASDCDRFTWSQVSSAGGCDPLLREGSADTECYFSGGSPVVSTIVRAMETSDHFNSLGRAENVVRTEYAYHDGYYEGIEQEFRGFGAADAIAVGDFDHPTSITRTHFHQGRRPSSIARSRLADNPYEPLKARAFLTETFDEYGEYLASVQSGYAVRDLYVGLDGRTIRYAFVAQTDELRYNVADWTPGTDVIADLPAIVWQDDGGTTTTTETRSLVARGGEGPTSQAGYAHVRSTVDEVDNVGNLLEQTAHGRILGEFGETPSEEIVSHAEAALIDEGSWIWRTLRTFVDGDGTAVDLGDTTNTYNEVGDLVRTTTAADLIGDPFEFGDDDGLVDSSAVAESFTQDDQTIESSTEYDAWGNALKTCAGADLANDPDEDCLRFASVEYDEAYDQLPQQESIATGKSSGVFTLLATAATWDRPCGLLVTATDPNDEVTEVGYDGLGRLTSIRAPGASVPTHRFTYELVSSGLPVSVVYAYQETNGAAIGTSVKTRTYVDGLGRTRAVLTAAPSSRWEQAGVTTFTARGTARDAWQTHLLPAGEPSLTLAVALPSTATHFGGTVGCATTSLYDAFGRAVAATECLGGALEASTVTKYLALSTEVWDPLDMEEEHVFENTPTISRTDGHGRAIDQILINRRFDGIFTGGDDGYASGYEYYRLQTTYRPDGAVTSIVRSEVNGFLPSATLVSSRTLTRTFTHDTVGRRIASTDPDTDNPGGDPENETWRYLFNRVGDLVAVRDPRGCGQNFYYDHAGRLIAEDYVMCDEAQAPADMGDDDVGSSAIALEEIGGSGHSVDVRYYFDADPPWDGDFAAASPARPDPVEMTDDDLFLKGRVSAVSDRGQRTLYAYDPRGRVVWTGRAVAMIPDEYSLGTTLTDPPTVVTSDAVADSSRVYDIDHIYVTLPAYDHADRPEYLTLPTNYDWTGMGSAPTVQGRMYYNELGLPSRVDSIIGGTTYKVVGSMTYTRDRLLSGMDWDHFKTGIDNSSLTFTYDARRRVTRESMTREPNTSAPAGDIDRVGTYVFYRDHDWDAANNLTQILDSVAVAEFPAGYRPSRTRIDHDGLYRVARTRIDYKPTSGTWTTDTAYDWRTNQNLHQPSDPMRETPAPMVPTKPSNRVAQLNHQYDWLANMTSWSDDQSNFYERSIGTITNGFTEGERPSGLYLSTNLATSAPSYNAGIDRGGWVEVDYGVSGNVVAMTVHARCFDQAMGNVCYDQGGSLSSRRSAFRSRCVCAGEQHYQYRYDEVNRISEARRYDRGGSGSWTLEVRHRYRYDAGNDRIIKQVLEPSASERLHLYVYPGDFERSGVARNMGGDQYVTDATLGTESQYVIGGGRIVWKQAAASAGSIALTENVRITYAVGDLLGTTSAVMDVLTGELIETRTYYPNGAQETLRVQSDVLLQPEPHGFTGKEADDEVGITYFGQRYLFQHLGRWTTPDPLHIHATGGREALNSYHYLAGNLLQATDPLGLDVRVVTPAGDQWLDNDAARQFVETTVTEMQRLTNDRLGITGDGRVIIVERAESGNLPEGTALVRRAVDSAQLIRIQRGDANMTDADMGEKVSNGLGTGSIVNWTAQNSRSRLIDTSGGRTRGVVGTSPKHISLAHELIHADRNARGVSLGHWLRDDNGRPVERPIRGPFDFGYGLEQNRGYRRYPDEEGRATPEINPAEEFEVTGLDYHPMRGSPPQPDPTTLVQPGGDPNETTEQEIRAEQGEPPRANYTD